MGTASLDPDPDPDPDCFNLSDSKTIFPTTPAIDTSTWFERGFSTVNSSGNATALNSISLTPWHYLRR